MTKLLLTSYPLTRHRHRAGGYPALLWHATINTTQIYTNVGQDRLEKVVEVI